MTSPQIAEAITLLKDAAFMLQDIRKARQLPAYGQVQDQYIALGKQIEDFIKRVEEQFE